MTKICFIVPAHWEAFMGGSQYQAKFLLEHLAATGRYEISYLARRTKAGYRPTDHRVFTIGGVPGLRRYTDAFDSLSLFTTLRDLRPDVIYQRAASAYTGVAAFFAKRAGIPMIWHIASDLEVVPFELRLNARTLPKLIQKKFLEYGLRNATHVIAQTDTQIDLLERNYGRRADVLIHNFQPSPDEVVEKTGRVQVVWVANLKPNKQAEIFVQVARELTDCAGVDFVMIGSPSEDAVWQKKMDMLVADTPNLRYLGHQSQTRVNQILARAHVLVNTSEYEGLSNTFIQAWMRAVPVVSLNTNPDEVLTGARGLCANGSFTELTAHIRRLIDNPSMRVTIGQRARKEALAEFSMDNVQQLAAFIESTLERSAEGLASA